MENKSDIQIAQETKMEHIRKIAEKAGIDENILSSIGNYKAKIDLGLLDDMRDRKNGKLILVTAITPHPRARARRRRLSASATGSAR
jgi:formate--tetrahydrofolate ligase